MSSVIVINSFEIVKTITNKAINNHKYVINYWHKKDIMDKEKQRDLVE